MQFMEFYLWRTSYFLDQRLKSFSKSVSSNIGSESLGWWQLHIEVYISLFWFDWNHQRSLLWKWFACQQNLFRICQGDPSFFFLQFSLRLRTLAVADLEYMWSRPNLSWQVRHSSRSQLQRSCIASPPWICSHSSKTIRIFSNFWAKAPHLGTPWTSQSPSPSHHPSISRWFPPLSVCQSAGSYLEAEISLVHTHPALAFWHFLASLKIPWIRH